MNAQEDLPFVQLPSVQLIGAQKSGTSSIADWIFEGGFRRPRVIGSEPWYYSKEVHFFDVDHRYNQGLRFYAERFTNEDGMALGGPTMDATPDTLQFAERVRSTYENAGGNQANTLKIVVILREPNSRELSFYNHLGHDLKTLKPHERTSGNEQIVKSDGSTMSFDEFVDSISLPALQGASKSGRSSRHGLYAKHLREWFECFDRKQILVLSFQELQDNPRDLQDRIKSFLGADIPGQLRQANSNDHNSKLPRPSAAAKAKLEAVLDKHDEDLYRLLEAHPGPPMEQHPFPRFDRNDFRKP